VFLDEGAPLAALLDRLAAPGRWEQVAGTVPGMIEPLSERELHYQLLLLLRNPNALMAGVVLPVLLLVLASTQHAHLAVAVLASRVVLGVTLIAYLTHAAGLVAAREAGVLKRWRATPLPRWCYFAGRICATVLMALASGTLTVLAGVLLYHAQLRAGAALSLLVVLTLAALAWASVGTAVTAFIPSAEAAQPLLSLSYFPVMLLSGVFGTISGAPGWLTTLLGYLPGQPTVDAATGALHAAGGALSLPGHDLAVLAAWAIAGLLASLRLFRWEPTATR
jgi:ABC-2 type transport system permease protein